MKNALLVLIVSLLALSAQAQRNIVSTLGANEPGVKNVFIGDGAGGMNFGFITRVGLIGYHNVIVGMDAGYMLEGGSQNTLLGWESGHEITVGNNNSFVGSQAGRFNTTGNYNSFVGTQAGFTNTTGANNAFMGYNAGYFNQTGYSNVFLGVSAGYKNVGGYSNSFVGIKAGNSNTEGFENVFTGFQSGYSNTTGTKNTFSGTYAGYSNQTSNYNAFLGYAAGFNNTTGNNNTFIGAGAGDYNMAGYANVALGVNSGFYNQMGHNNVMLGDSAGLKTTASRNLSVGSKAGYNNITGSDNTFLGTAADAMPGKTNLTNAAAIGANALVAISNAIVLGDTTLNTKVGIGITAPAYPLDVRGTINIRNQGRLKFAQRVDLQADDQEYVVLTAGVAGQSGLRLANLNSTSPTVTSTDRFLSVDAEGRVVLSRYRVQVAQANEWSDTVFAPTYRLRPLDEVARYITANQHLPGVPSAQEMASQGMDAALLNAKLLEKIEELTLYLIAQKSQMIDQKQDYQRQIDAQNHKIDRLVRHSQSCQQHVVKHP